MFSQINNFFSLSFTIRANKCHLSFFLFCVALHGNNDALKDNNQNLSCILSCRKMNFSCITVHPPDPSRPSPPLTPPPTYSALILAKLERNLCQQPGHCAPPEPHPCGKAWPRVCVWGWGGVRRGGHAVRHVRLGQREPPLIPGGPLSTWRGPEWHVTNDFAEPPIFMHERRLCESRASPRRWGRLTAVITSRRCSSKFSTSAILKPGGIFSFPVAERAVGIQTA